LRRTAFVYVALADMHVDEIERLFAASGAE